MVGKATLGFPTRTAAVLALVAEGLSNREIAARIGIKTGTVAAMRCNARAPRSSSSARRSPRGRTCADDTAHLTINDLFPYHQREMVRAHAARRNMTTQRLIQAIVDTVIEEDLVDAVLDDEETGS